MEFGKGEKEESMMYVVVKTTPEKDRFSSTVLHTYEAITYKQYTLEWRKWHDRLYCGPLKKDHAIALNNHLNSGTYKTFRC